MSYLLDTNIVSELRKGERCDPGLSAWYAAASPNDLFLSTLVLGEIRKGIEILGALIHNAVNAREIRDSHPALALV